MTPIPVERKQDERGQVQPWDADDWKERPTAERLQVVHDLMDDEGTCPYFRRGEPGQDPRGTCSFGCRDEPNCVTSQWGPYPSQLLREVIHDLTTTSPAARGASDG